MAIADEHEQRVKEINRRVRTLENRFCDEKPQRLWVTRTVGEELALNDDRCIEILGECGFLPTGRFGIVNVGQIPKGLNAKDLETFLRAYGAETRGFQPKTTGISRGTEDAVR